MYDDKPDLRYLQKSSFQGFQGKQVTFGIAAIRQGIKADVLILSHIHLLTFARILRKLKPSLRVILLAHGIEVWRSLQNWKKHLLNKIEIWAVSNYTASQLKEINSIDAKNIRILNNSLDPYFELSKEKTKSALLLQRYGISENQKIILTICRLSASEQYKGYDLVIQNLKQLIIQHPNLIYLLGGKTDPEKRTRIMQLIKDCKIEKHVILTDYINQAELSLHYQLADVFIMPSKAEGFGLVFIEAAAHGCSVIAGNKDGSTDALLNGKLGTLIDPEDGDAIFQSIKSALNNPLTIEQKLEQQEMVLDAFGFNNYRLKVSDLLRSTPYLTP